VLTCVAGSVLQWKGEGDHLCARECCSALQCVAVCCSVLQCVAASCGGKERKRILRDRAQVYEYVLMLCLSACVSVRVAVCGSVCECA